MNYKKIAINCCGIHAGGGVQVATSFIDELTHLDYSDLDIHIFVSSEVNENLEKISSNLSIFKNYTIKNFYGLSAFFSNLSENDSNFSLVFTIFGPNYLLIQNGIQIVGFAQPWIINNSAYQILNLKNKILYKIKYYLQRLFFKRADTLIVELDHVKSCLVNQGVKSSKDIEIVRNCISSVFLNPNSWQPINIERPANSFSIGFLGRDYIHKNTSILPLIKDILKYKHNLNVTFFVTFNDLEWSFKSHSFKNKIINVGSLSMAQCPSFYENMDAVIFPSLLECFSATPLEAMAMKKPLFASDRGFVRDVCADYAWYFDPLNSESAADVIAEYINKHYCKDDLRLSAARERVLNFSSARGRAERYLEIIRRSLSKNS